jgi:rhodanese-related sulfurtransferase
MKTKSIIYFLGVLFIVSCNSQSKKYKNQDVTTVSKIIETTNNLQILDVRTPQEFEEGHLKNAVNKNWYDSNFSSKLENLDKSKPILIYCKAGGRSTRASEKLTEMGFKKVLNMEGGIDQWSVSGFPTEK